MRDKATVCLITMLALICAFPISANAATKGTVPVADSSFGVVGDVGDVGDLTAGNVVNTLSLMASVQQLVPSMGDYYVFSASTDTNELLGYPGYYIGKADFGDSNEKQTTYATEMSDGTSVVLPEGGTIELFPGKKSCNARYKYLSVFEDPSMGMLSLKQYMYKYDYVLLRVDYAVGKTTADQYAAAVSQLLQETPIEYVYQE